MKFNLGNLYKTCGIESIISTDSKYMNELVKCFERFIQLDFGDLCEDDVKSNLNAIKYGERILGSYMTSHGKIYIITEADRSSTTILLAEEY